MRNLFKKLFALLLCTAMLFALLPAFATAEDGENDDPAIELPEVDDAEPAEEEPLPFEPEEEPTEEPAENGESPVIMEYESEDEANELLVSAPIGEVKGTPPENSTVIEEEFAFNLNCLYEITTPGETVFRPVTAEDDGYFNFHIKSDHVRLLFTDSEFNVLLEAETEVDYAQELQALTYRDGGQKYYVGVSFQDPERTGSFNVVVHQYSANACGNNMTWSFDEETGELSIGAGTMWNFTPETVPWRAYREQIKTLRISSNGSTIIGQYAFYECSNLESISNVNKIAAIASYAFYGTALREMIWPDHCSLGTYGGVGSYAFANCKELKTFTVGKSNNSYGIGDYAFYNSGLETAMFVSNLHEIKSYAFAECKNLVAVSLPNEKTMHGYGVTIGDFVFQNCGLQSLWIPKSVTEIGVGVLAGCTQLAPNALKVSDYSETFKAKDGLLLTKDGKTLLAAVYQTASGAYTTPTGICNIASGAFYGCPALSELTLSPGVKMVGELAFTDCTSLNTITIPLTLQEIKKNSCTNCDALMDVYYLGTEEERDAKLTIGDDNDALLYAEWHYQEPCSFDGTIEWNAEDVQMKGTTPYVVWNGDAFTPRFTLKTAAGEPVDPATYSVEYRENVNAGTAYIFVTFSEGYAGTMRLFFKIYLPATTETSIWNIKDGIKLSWKPVEGAAGYVIYRRAWNLQSAGWTTFERWNNTTATTWTDTTVYAGTRYQYGVKAYFNRRMDPVTGAEVGGNVGDNFNLGMVGPLKTTVRITTRHLNQLQAGYRSITANWDGSKVFTGYQIKYATDAAFTKDVKSVKISDSKAQSTVLSSLTNGTAYYVCIRSFHNFEGMTYFGEWSNVIHARPGSGETVYDVMYRALLIGENNYKNNQALKGPVNDMKAMEGMLKGLKRPFVVKTLPNSKRAAFMSAIKSTYADADDNDISLFYYSGHGVDAGGNDTYQGALVPIDENYITMNDLAKELSKVKGRVIVILDSCMSGAAIQPKSAHSTANGADPIEDVSEAFYESAVEAFSGYYLDAEDGEPASNTRMGEFRKSKFIVITAATAYRSSYEGKFDGTGYYQGAFTAALIKGMGCKYLTGSYTGSMPADTNKNKQVTLYEIYSYAQNQAYNWTRQTARYFGPDNEVLFRR